MGSDSQYKVYLCFEDTTSTHYKSSVINNVCNTLELNKTKEVANFKGPF